MGGTLGRTVNINELGGLMTQYIVLLRGINVGGRNRLPMARLREILGAGGLTDVRTYIQSGNVVFQSDETDRSALARHIGDAIEAGVGFRPAVMVLTNEALNTAVERNPFADQVADHKTLHFYFLAEPPANPDFAALTALQSPTERFRLDDAVFYLFAPDGIGRSKLAAQVERHLGVAATARNLRTVEKLRGLAAA